MGAAVQAAATQLLDLTVGSTLRAVLEANASVVLWVQWLILQTLQMTRAATSSGPDLDSWMEDFSLTRLPARPASGSVTMSRFVASTAALIPAGSLVRTADNTQTFAVVADLTSSTWNAAQNGYVEATGVISLDVPVLAQAPGAAGNVQAGTVSVLASALPGIDLVTNVNAFQNGSDAESDSAFRARFQNFLATRSRATPLAVANAITGIQQGMSYVIQENVDPTGAVLMGNFVVIVDDGSGYPASSLLATVQSAIESVRPVGSSFAVLPPLVTNVTVELTATLTPGADKTQIAPVMVSSISNYINSLPLGAPLPISRVAQLAYSAAPQVVNVTGIILNGASADIVVPASGVIKADQIVVE
jgi:uncharacterized phage protein gp47/JayE